MRARALGIAVGVGLAAALFLSLSPGEEPRSNVILLSIDTLRPDHLGVYGYPRGTSPQIDALAAESIVFDQAIAHSASTLVSHASLLTSLLPQHHGASVGRQTAVPEKVSTLAEVLRENGYATASFNGGMQLDPVYGLGQGFDLYESVRLKDAVAHSLRGPEDRLQSGVERALRWIEATSERPFFVFLHSYEVHHPYTPREPFWAPSQADYAGVVPRDVPVELLEAAIHGTVKLDADDRQRIVDAYDAEIRSADAAVGVLVRELERMSLLDGTLLVLTSDHGEEFGERGWMGWHGHTLYDELLRVPLLIRLPGGKAGGRRIAHQVRGIDVAPTILDVLALEIPPAFQGRRLLRAGAGDGAQPAVSWRDTRPEEDFVSIRTEEWKLERGRLYHLAEDRGETRDLSASRRLQAERLEAALHALVGQREREPGTPVEPDPALVERLRALGYLGDEGGAAPPPAGGLRGAYYANADWEGEPVFVRTDPRIEFDWLAPPWPLPPPFGVEWTGELHVERAGRHVFHLESDDGSTLEIGGRLVVDNGGRHAIQARSGAIELGAGWHPIRVRYFNALLGGMVRLAWEPAGGALAAVPAEALRQAEPR